MKYLLPQTYLAILGPILRLLMHIRFLPVHIRSLLFVPLPISGDSILHIPTPVPLTPVPFYLIPKLSRNTWISCSIVRTMTQTAHLISPMITLDQGHTAFMIACTMTSMATFLLCCYPLLKHHQLHLVAHYHRQSLKPVLCWLAHRFYQSTMA